MRVEVRVVLQDLRALPVRGVQSYESDDLTDVKGRLVLRVRIVSWLICANRRVTSGALAARSSCYAALGRCYVCFLRGGRERCDLLWRNVLSWCGRCVRAAGEQ